MCKQELGRMKVWSSFNYAMWRDCSVYFVYLVFQSSYWPKLPYSQVPIFTRAYSPTVESDSTSDIHCETPISLRSRLSEWGRKLPFKVSYALLITRESSGNFIWSWDSPRQQVEKDDNE